MKHGDIMVIFHSYVKLPEVTVIDVQIKDQDE